MTNRNLKMIALLLLLLLFALGLACCKTADKAAEKDANYLAMSN